MPQNWDVAELTTQTFAQETGREDFPVFVDFWADWCVPCRMMEPMIEALAHEYSERVLFRKLNIDLYRKITQEFDISGVPTFMIFHQGRVVWREVGALSKKKIKEALAQVIPAEQV